MPSPENGEWVIKHRPAKKVINNQFTKDDPEYQELVFFLIIQRKPLFYIINIIAPCVLFSSLCLLVYYLPAKGLFPFSPPFQNVTTPKRAGEFVETQNRIKILFRVIAQLTQV